MEIKPIAAPDFDGRAMEIKPNATPEEIYVQIAATDVNALTDYYIQPYYSQADDSACTNDASNESTSTGKRKKLHYKQAFNDQWLREDGLKDWVARDPADRFSVICKVCNCKLTNTNKTGLLAHVECKKHQKNLGTKGGSKPRTRFCKKLFVEDIDDKVARAEIVLSAFVAEHNTLFAHADHLVECMKYMFPDSVIASKLAWKRTRTSHIVQEGIAFQERQDLVSVCQRQRFSVITDESTDISDTQVLGIVVRHFDEKRCRVVDSLLDVIKVEDGSGTGLYNAFRNLLQDKQIPLSNILGFASDNCTTLTGSESEFQQHLKRDVGGDVFVMGCVCHSFVLCANNASACLPSWLEEFVKNLCVYFSHQSVQNNTFSWIQESGGSADGGGGVLKCETRWLARESVVNRILEQWDELLLYFHTVGVKDAGDGTSYIYQTMNAAGTKHVLLFLSYILGKVSAMNLEFQSESFRIHKLYDVISGEYCSILGMFIKDDIVKSRQLSEVDPYDVRLHKKLSEVDVGGRCSAQLVRQPLGEKEEQFRTDVTKFLMELCGQMRTRFLFSDESVVAKLRIMDPKSITNAIPGAERPSVISLAIHFPSVVSEAQLDLLDEQWRNLYFARSSTNSLAGLEPPEFWIRLKEIVDADLQPRYGLLSDFMCSLLVLPHSSACVERIFAQVSQAKKTRPTTRLHCDTVANTLIAKEAVMTQSSSGCYAWMPSKRLLEDVKEGRCCKRFKDKMGLYKKQGNIDFVDLSLYSSGDVEGGGDGNH